MNARAVYFQGPRSVEVRDEVLPRPGRGEVRVHTEASALSAGTELLFYRGELEAGVCVDATLPGMGQPLTYPLRYGYSSVGRIVELGAGVDGAWRGRRVFGFVPHQSHTVAPLEHLVPLPDGLDAQTGCLLASMETAVSLVMDGAPVLGEEVAVVGQGMVGVLVAALLARLGVASLTVVDRSAARLARAEPAWAGKAVARCSEGEALPAGRCDLVYELTGNPAALAKALALLRCEGRLVIGSWYGAKGGTLGFGTREHRNRNTLLFSQVSRIDSRWAGRFDKARRLQVALDWLQRLPVAALVTHRFPLEQAAEAYRLADERPDEALQILFTYPSSDDAAS